MATNKPASDESVRYGVNWGGGSIGQLRQYIPRNIAVSLRIAEILNRQHNDVSWQARNEANQARYGKIVDDLDVEIGFIP
jgi:hypothetical protein